MNLFQTLLRPDRDEDAGRALIANAANLLQIGEFQLLQLAYADWHGKEMSKAIASAVFHEFMIRSRTPPWARHYARRIVELDAKGELNDMAPGYHRYDTEGVRDQASSGAHGFIVAVVVIAGFLGGSLAIASYSVSLSGTCINDLPPCLTSGEMELPARR